MQYRLYRHTAIFFIVFIINTVYPTLSSTLLTLVIPLEPRLRNVQMPQRHVHIFLIGRFSHNIYRVKRN